MNIDTFWSLVESVHTGAPGDMKEKCGLLAAELRSLPCEEIVSFEEHFSDLYYQAYNWDIWAAAYMMKGGCSNDSFIDFRSTLISLGRDAYETALRDVDSLAEFNIDSAWATYEGYQYVAGNVYEEKGCPRMGDSAEAIRHKKQHPKEPTGRDWEEWDLPERYPRLAAKYGWEERDWSEARKAHAKFLEHMAKGHQLAQLMLDAGIIPTSGLIPPPRIVREVLRSGRSPSLAAKVQAWHPFDLDEGHYWIAARELRQPSAEALKYRADLTGVTFDVDTEAPSVTTYAEWLDSLIARGQMIKK